MDAKEIIGQLESAGRKLPVRALREAVAKQAEVTPYLLDLLIKARHALAVSAEVPDNDAFIFALYLLAYFREARALPVIASFFSIPGEITLDITGDMMTDDLDRILASVGHGETGPIQALIESQDVNEYVRGAAVKSMGIMMVHGELDRSHLVSYYRNLLQGGLEPEAAFVVAEVVATAAETRLTELYGDIVRAFEKGLVDDSFVDLDHVDAQFADKGGPLRRDLATELRFSYIDEPVSELGHWWR